jgi:hypothetical protein
MYVTAEYTYKPILYGLRWWTLVWGFLMILAGVLEIIVTLAMVNDSEREDAWDSLTPLGQEYFDDDQDKLVEAYQINMTIIAIFMLLVGAVIAIEAFAGFYLYSYLPDDYVPLKSEPDPNDDVFDDERER